MKPQPPTAPQGRLLGVTLIELLVVIANITSWGSGHRGCFYQEDLGPAFELQQQAIAAVP